MIENYYPILIVFILASAFVCISLVATHYFGPRVKNAVKDMPYESGVDLVLKDLGISDNQDQRANLRDQRSEKEGGLIMDRIEKGLQSGVMPDLRGLNLKDALYLLESYVQVQVIGSGGVIKQSIKTGDKFIMGSVIKLELA